MVQGAASSLQLDSSLPALKLGKLKTATPKSSANSPVAGSPSPQDALTSVLAATAVANGRGDSPKGSPLAIAASSGTGSAALAAKSRLNGVGLGADTPLSIVPSTKKGRKSQSLATEAITRAAERAMAVVGRFPNSGQGFLLMPRITVLHGHRTLT